MLRLRLRLGDDSLWNIRWLGNGYTEIDRRSEGRRRLRNGTDEDRIRENIPDWGLMNQRG